MGDTRISLQRNALDTVGGYTTESLTHGQRDVRPACGYLPSRTALSLPVCRYSVYVSLRVGGRDGLNGWLHTEMVYPQSPVCVLTY